MRIIDESPCESREPHGRHYTDHARMFWCPGVEAKADAERLDVPARHRAQGCVCPGERAMSHWGAVILGTATGVIVTLCGLSIVSDWQAWILLAWAPATHVLRDLFFERRP